LIDSEIRFIKHFDLTFKLHLHVQSVSKQTNILSSWSLPRAVSTQYRCQPRGSATLEWLYNPRCGIR